MEWKAFKEQLPEIDRLILYGNHRWIETGIYHPENERLIRGRLHYKDVTHWCYIDSPPVVDIEVYKWK